MTDNFFKNHELSLWIFAVGITVIMSILIGGGIAVILLTFVLAQHIDYFSTMEYFVFAGALGVIMSLTTSITNLLIIRGRAYAVGINIINIYFQICCYILFAVFLEHKDKWQGLVFSILPFLSLWLMSTPRYRAFVAYHEALHKDPIGFRQKLLERISG
ncbi:hypothetical protein [Vibrio tapetis]|uniref:Uncharacterized protein n=1 Tax=Vibrio tapetis subsp. tapetis TaxID=1671868 RepID=A0A2N8ZJ98_9VIBR|nr:hypothetical protein [Vibrio tapetis]SON51980.1 conserved membrane protein of unknown function [Vibrio tapetis subsp. tapetis]